MPATMQSGFGIAGVADGSQSQIERMGKTGEKIVGLAGTGAFYDWASRGRVYTACTQTVVTFGTALTSTAVTFTINNAAGSGFYFAILHCGVTMVTSTTAGSLVYARSTPATTAQASTLTSANYLGTSGAATTSSSCTLGATPTAIRILASGFTTNANAFNHDYVDGAIVVPQNTSITIQGITIAGTGLIDMCWAEIPIT